MQLKSTSAILMASFLLAITPALSNAQNLETFEGVIPTQGTRPTVFVNAGQSFSITTGNCFGGGTFGVFVPNNQYYKCGASTTSTSTGGGYGVGTTCASGVCTGSSNNFIDNGGNLIANPIYSIKSTNAALFTIKSVYVYNSSDNSASPSDAGGVTFRGKIAGNVVFTYTKTTGFNTNTGINKGFTFIDFASVNYATTNIDELEMQTGNSSNYFAVDNFTWGISTPLPVSLMSFTAQQKKNDIVLNWSAARESGFRYYEVERSQDGKAFTKIGTVQPAGDNSTYNYTDQRYATGANFYRLRMVDKDGAAEYSSVASVYIEQVQDMTKVYPNPATDKLSVMLDHTTTATFQLIDMTGRILQTAQLTAALTEINIASLPMGVYQYRLFNPELGLIQQGKITKK